MQYGKQTCNSVSPYPVVSDILTLPFWSSLLSSGQSPLWHAIYAGLDICSMPHIVKLHVMLNFGARMMAQITRVIRLENSRCSLKTEDKYNPFLHDSALYFALPFSDQVLTTADPTRKSADNWQRAIVPQWRTLRPTGSNVCDKYRLRARGIIVSCLEMANPSPSTGCLLLWDSTSGRIM